MIVVGCAQPPPPPGPSCQYPTPPPTRRPPPRPDCLPPPPPPPVPGLSQQQSCRRCGRMDCVAMGSECSLPSDSPAVQCKCHPGTDCAKVTAMRPSQAPPGSRVFNRRGGSKRAQLTGPLISYYELWRQRRKLKLVKFFFPNTRQMMFFLNPLDVLIPKTPFSFFAQLGFGGPIN